MDFSEIQKTRVDGKFQMLNGNFYVALDENLLRAYISLERLDVKRMCNLAAPSRSRWCRLRAASA